MTPFAARIRSLDPQFVRSIHRAHNGHALLKASLDLLLMGAAAGLLLWKSTSVLALGAVLMIGVLQNAWFEATHWAVHGSLFTSRIANKVFGYFGAFMCFRPYHYYRANHLGHHRHLGDPDKDPELFGGTPVLDPTMGRRIFRLIGYATKGVIAQYLLLLRVAIAPSERHRLTTMPFVKPDGYTSLIWECRALLVLYGSMAAAAAYFFSPLVVCYWPLALWVHFFFFFFFGTPEHAGLYEEKRSDRLKKADGVGTESHASAQVAMTRLFSSNFLVRYLRWNETYHAAHHAYPSANYRSLPRLVHAIGDGFPNRRSSYLEFVLNGDDRKRDDLPSLDRPDSQSESTPFAMPPAPTGLQPGAATNESTSYDHGG